MALTRDIVPVFPVGATFRRAVAADTVVFKGAALSIDASGDVIPLAETRPFIGFAIEHCDNSGGSAGAADVSVQSGGRVVLTVPAVAATDIGRAVYATDDNTFSIAWSAGAVLIGTIETVESAGCSVRYSLSPAISPVGDTSGGVAGTDVVDAGAAYSQAKVNANFATLIAAVNKLIARVG